MSTPTIRHRRSRALLALALGGLGVTSAEAAAPAPNTDPLAPKVFHASVMAAGGDIMPIDGANLGSTSAYAVSGSGTPVALPVVQRVGTTWLSVQLPATLPTPLAVYLQNSHGASAALPLNNAVPKHLDATQIVPGGRFRVLGLNLVVPGRTPSVTVGGLPATINLSASNAYILAVTAPASLATGRDVTVQVSNGNGAAPTPLANKVSVTAGSGDPLGLGVGWGGGFTFTKHVVTAHPVCNGVTDDSWAIESAVIQASKDGGGIVQLPSGVCRIKSTVNLASRVILKGAGQNSTTLRYEGNYPIYANGFDLVGLQDLQLLNAGPVQEGAIWQHNTRSLIQRVTITMGMSRQWYMSFNRDFIFDHNVVSQTGSYNQQNPYMFNYSAGLLFSHNHSTNKNGSPTFQFMRDSLLWDNEFTRDASSQNENPVVVHHGFVTDFSIRISLMYNKFDVINGPVLNKLRNDGETFLVEGGGGNRTENLGTVKSATATTLTDAANTINVDPFGAGTISESYAVAIVAGKGAGQRRRVVGYANATLTIDKPWDVVPDTTSRYSTFVWALKDAILFSNTLTDNPRGIWLYQCSVEGVVITGNTISQGGGIFLRSYQNLAQKTMTVQDDVVIRGNTIENSTGRWLSYISVAAVSSDTQQFGTADTNIEVRGNHLTANTPNLSSNTEDRAGQEGYSALLYIEPGGGQVSAAIPNVLGTMLQGNSCQNCAHPFTIGTGDYGTAIVANQPGVAASGSITDRAALGAGFGAAANSLKQ